MRKIVHFSLASHDEVIYRDEADLGRGFNCLAEACLETDSRLLADGLMSTHHHGIAQTDDCKALIHTERYAYTRYFNARYGRKGRLGEQKPFMLTIEGAFHLLVALNYVNRQGLHHGIAATPFDYPFCSANAFFRKELGKEDTRRLMPADQRYKYLPDRSSIPANVRMTDSGMLFQEDIIDTSYVEQVYITPRNYIFQMNKLSDEKWNEQQRSDGTDTPIITLELIETGVGGIDVEQLLRNENGRVNTNQMKDMDLCKLIDTVYIPRILKGGQVKSVYQLSLTQRNDLCNTLWQDIPRIYKKRTTVPQLKRCACLNY